MGVQFIENDLYDEDDEDYQCSKCFNFNTNASASSTQKQETLESNFREHLENQHYHHEQQQHHQFSQQTQNILSSKDLVGNSKEFRIENNKCNLRIIGNGNRIRITHNSGNIQIIGNSTRLKITKNSGNIKYTGNEGRICLGSESTQQLVDYIGCNGLLKIVNSTEFNKSPKCNENNNKSRKTTEISPTVIVNNKNSLRTNSPGNAFTGTSPNSATSTRSSLEPRTKSASFDELIDKKLENWQHFTDLLEHNGWQHFTKVSLPNLKDNINESSACNCKCKKIQNKSFNSNINKSKNKNNSKSNKNNQSSSSKGININTNRNVENNFGNIIIKNSVNVSIA